MKTSTLTIMFKQSCFGARVQVTMADSFGRSVVLLDRWVFLRSQAVAAKAYAVLVASKFNAGFVHV